MSALRSDLRIALAIAQKDATSELRGRHATVSTLFFAAIVLLLFGVAIGPDPSRLALAAPGLLWLAIVFAGILAVGRLHLLETDDGALEQLAAYPVDRRVIYAGKTLAGFGAMLVLGIVVLGAVGVLYSIDLAGAWAPLLVTLGLGAFGVAAVGTFYAGITVRMRAREVMLPLLMLPILAPLLIGAVKATAAALAGDPLGELWSWLQLLAAFDVIMAVAGAATYGLLLEE